MEYVPGEAATVCIVEVLPFPHRKATGSTPPDDVAVREICVAVRAPTHDAVNAEAAPANAKHTTKAMPTIEASKLFRKTM